MTRPAPTQRRRLRKPLRQQAPATTTPGGTFDAAQSEDSGCGADKVAARWLNALPTEDAKADIRAKAGDRPIRYYTEGDPITADYRPERLNVELGADGRIKRFRCG